MTGACGFIGKHLMTSFEADGIFALGLDVVEPSSGSPRQKYLNMNFSDFKALREEIKKNEVTHIVHLASSTLPKSSNEDMKYDVTSNVVGTLSLLEVAVACGVKKIIYLSSGGTIYGPDVSIPIDEKHPTNPICSYGIGKLAVEKYLNLFQHLHGLDYVSLRAANPYGPGQNPAGGQGLIATFLHKILAKETIEIWGDGSVVRDYFYISDLIDLIKVSIKSGVSGVFNAGSGVGVSINEVLALLEGTLDTSATIAFHPHRDFDVPKIVLDCSAADRVFDWRADTTLQDGVSQFADWYRHQQNTS